MRRFGAYVEPREACFAVQNAYDCWARAPAVDAVRAFLDYVIALDREEGASSAYATPALLATATSERGGAAPSGDTCEQRDSDGCDGHSVPAGSLRAVPVEGPLRAQFVLRRPIDSRPLCWLPAGEPIRFDDPVPVGAMWCATCCPA